MTGEEFKEALRTLRLSQRKFCVETGISEPTANRWACAKQKSIPPLAAAYINLRLRLKEIQPA